MRRKSINPVQWGLAFSMDQAEVIEGATRHLHCSGQTALKDDPESEMGVSVVHPGDIRGQIAYALDGIDQLLAGAGMTRANLTSLRFYTTKVETFLDNYDVYADWIAPAGIRPPQSLLGVQQLALPGLVVEIEATAAA